MVVNLSGEVCVVSLGRFEHDLGKEFQFWTMFVNTAGRYLRPICELVRGKVDFPKRSFANKASQGIIADCV